MSSEGIKFDQDKPNMSAIPKEAMWKMGQALAYGAKKYGNGNFRNGMDIDRQISAAVRHIYQFLDGESEDSESGVCHLGHALASLAMACYTLENCEGRDTRFKGDVEKHEKPK